MLLSTLYTKCCWAIEKNNMEFMTFGLGKKKKNFKGFSDTNTSFNN